MFSTKKILGVFLLCLLLGSVSAMATDLYITFWDISVIKTRTSPTQEVLDLTSNGAGTLKAVAGTTWFPPGVTTLPYEFKQLQLAWPVPAITSTNQLDVSHRLESVIQDCQRQAALVQAKPETYRIKLAILNVVGQVSWLPTAERMVVPNLDQAIFSCALIKG